MSARGKALLAFGVLVALAVVERWRLANPPAASSTAPADEFSATRALATLRAVSLDAPHPPGSPAHDVVRDRITAHLRALDYEVDVQRTFACSPAATCATVENLIATIPGQPRGGKRVTVVAHYDSVPAGPGASDDGTGVATALEIARAVRHEPLANPVAFLIDDGEEAGLLGAEAFVADPARSKDTGFVINIEARGTSGTPFLFETSRDRRWLMPIVAGALPHPVTTSLFATIYELLPNDTDLTVFKRAGLPGINFAYLGDATQYHTPLDNFADVDERSVQRRGDQVLAMVHAFGNARLEPGEAANAVWFDVLALFVVWWPAAWTPWLIAAALAVLAGATVLAARRREVTVTGAALGLVAFVAALALAFVLGAVLSWIAGLFRVPGALFPPHTWVLVAAASSGGIAIALAVAALVRRRASFDSIFIGVALAWNVSALAVALWLPGAAYVAVVPGAAMACFALVRNAAGASEEVASVGALVPTAVVFLPFALVTHEALGPDSVGMAVMMLALVGLTFAPMLAGSVRPAAVLLAAAVVIGVVGGLLPNTSPSHPLHLSIAHVTDAATGTARWQVDAPLPALRDAAPFEARLVAPWFGARGASEVAPAPAAGLAPPVVNVSTAQRDGLRVTTLDISSPRQAPRLRIAWRSDAVLESIRVNGIAPPPRTSRFRTWLAPGWHRVVVWGPSARIDIATRDAAPAEASVSDTSFGLPPSAAVLIQARDASGAVPSHDGDVTIVEQVAKW
jgi:hypothetical protein